MKPCPLTPHRELLFSTEYIFLKENKKRNQKILSAFFMQDTKNFGLSASRASVLNLVRFCPPPPENIWQYLKSFLVVTTKEMPPVSSGGGGGQRC